MVRKIISGIFYSLGGFFIYMICIIAFINFPKVGAFKFAIIGGFSVPALIFLVIGAAIHRFQNWKSSIGTVLLSATGFTLLAIISFICMLITPEIEEIYPHSKFALGMFNDYFSGFFVMLALAGLGGFLLRISKRKIAEPAIQN
jgi:hypothetical protein